MALVTEENTSKPSPNRPENSGVKEDLHGGRTGGINSSISRMHRPLSRNQLSESVSELTVALRQLLGGREGMDSIEVDVVPMPGNEHTMHYSAVLLVARMVLSQRKLAAVYTLILEGSAPALRPMVADANGVSFEMQRTVQDQWSETTWKKVREVVRLKWPAYEIFGAGASVVPAEVDFKDERRVHQLAWSSIEPLYSALESKAPDNFSRFNVTKHINRQTDRITAVVSYGEDNAESVNGLPIRSDITQVVRSTEVGVDSKSFESQLHRGGKDLCENNMFVNLAYFVPPPAAYGQQPITQCFVPQVVMTRFTTIDAPSTPELMFMGMTSALLLGDNWNWAAVFSNYGKGSIHDFGGIGLRLNPEDPTQPGTPIDTKSATFNDQALFQFLRAYVIPKPAFSIDVEDAGPESWFTQILLDAANGSEVANKWIISVLDNLYNGHFSASLPAGAPMFVTDGNRVHIGTFMDENKNLRDLREIDSLAIMNMTGDIDQSNLWESSFNDTAQPIEVRLAARLSIMKSLLGQNNVKVRGHAERITMTNAMMDALVRAAQAAGLSLDQEGLVPMYGPTHQPGNTFLSQFAMTANATGLVNSGTARGPIYGRHAFTSYR